MYQGASNVRRIAIDYRAALYSRSGIARSVRELGRHLPAAMGEIGLELHLFAHGWRKPLTVENGSKAQLHRLRIPGKSLPILAAVGLDAARLAGPAELFHWMDYVYPPLRRKGIRVVQTVHDIAFLEDESFHGEKGSRLLSRRFGDALQGSDLLLCPSQSSKLALERQFATLPPIRVIPFGADHVHRFNPKAERGRSRIDKIFGSKAPYMLALGTLEPRKNHAQLLRAWQSLESAKERPRLVIIGARGWGAEALHAGLQSIDKSEGLCWLEGVEDVELFDILAGARALLYPSSLEGFGFPPLEALNLGVPVLAGDCAALKEQLGDAALFVDGQDVDAIANGMRRLARDTALRCSLQANWEKRAARYLWATSARQHAQAYFDLLEGKHQITGQVT